MTTSPNGSSITLSVLVDAAGNWWGLNPSAASGTQVTLNGRIDPSTAHVVQLAYVDGVIWQRNLNNLWWGKTSSTAPWLPSGGTSISPLRHTVVQLATARLSAISRVTGKATLLTPPGGRQFSAEFSAAFD